jgi:hypothetical protein
MEELAEIGHGRLQLGRVSDRALAGDQRSEVKESF